MARQIKVDIDVNTKKGQTQVKNLSGSIKNLTNSSSTGLNKLKNSTSGATKGFSMLKAALPIAAVGILAKKILNLVDSVAKAGDQFNKMSARTGVSVEKLSALGFAAEQSGTNIGTLEKGLRYASDVMLDFSNGTGTAKKTLEALGITVTDSNGNLKKTPDFLMEVADKMKNMTDETKRVAYASEIFGAKAGTQLLPLLRLGSKGIRELTDEAKEAGIVMTTQEAQISADYVDAVNKMGKSWQSVVKIVGLELMPVLKDVIEDTTAWTSANRGLMKEKISEFIDNVTKAANNLWAIVSYDPAILEFGILGLIIWGKKGAALIGGLAHVGKAVWNIGTAITYAKNGMIEWSDLAGANFKELETMINGVEKKLLNIRDINNTSGRDFLFPKPTIGPTKENAAKLTSTGGDTPDVVVEKETTEKITEELNKRFEIGHTLLQGDFEAKAELRAYYDENELKMAEDLDEGKRLLAEENAAKMKEIETSIVNNMTDGFMDMIEGTKSASEAFGDMAKSIMSDISRMIVKMLVLWVVQKLVGIASGGGGAATGVGGSSSVMTGAPASMGSMWTGANGGLLNGGFQKFANGDPNVSSPTLGLIGEGQYNEAVIPLPDGRSVPVNMKGSGGGKNIENMNINITALDAKSFVELARKNPQAIVQPFIEAINGGNRSLIQAVRV